jgi:site-specific recombinase XerD
MVISHFPMEVVMLDRYYVRPVTVDRIRSCWIAPAIEQYVDWLTERRYSNRTVWRRIPLLVAFGEFAKNNGATELAQLPSHVEPFVSRWVSEHARGKRSVRARKKIGDCVRNPIRQMLRVGLPDYIGKGRPHKPDNPFEAQAPRFFSYLTEEKGLRPRTVEQYQFHLRQFAAHLERIGVSDLAAVSPTVLSGFVADYGPRLAWPTLRNACGALRVFLRYLHREGVSAKDLSGVVEFPQSYRLSGIPRSITWEQVEQVINSIDRRSASGKRDYAMLLLLAAYGLRAAEVAALTLDDIDWRNDRLKIRERKAGNSTTYPLSAVVGAAIVEYLKHGRPESKERTVFLRTVAPFVPISGAAVCSRAVYYIHKAGIKVPRPGSHTLRHSCVQRLVSANFSLKHIGDYVGHRNPTSTQVYAKVAIEALREVAQGDGEEVV